MSLVLIGLGGIFVVVAVIVAGVILARRQNHLANLSAPVIKVS